MPIFTFMLQKGVLVSRSLACYLKNEKYPRTPSDLISTVQKVKFPLRISSINLVLLESM